jgi:apolipoprotein D and lipocalin family protein
MSNRKRRVVATLVLLAGIVVLAVTTFMSSPGASLPTVAHVDLDRFMGRWYVLASIPTFLERGAHNAVETYELGPDRTIETTFTFRRGGFDGELKEYRPRGFVRSESNAVWGMQFVWPIKAEYRIAYLAPDYSLTVIGRSKRDYVWIMGRTPNILPVDYDRLVSMIGELGYDTRRLVRVPHRW